MENAKLDEFKRIMEQVIYAPTKAYAKQPLQQLEFLASQLNRNIDSNLSSKLREVINAASEASGQVKNKKHWEGVANRAWYVFETRVRNNGDEKET